MLQLSFRYPFKVQNGGLFISRGKGTHPTRTLDSYELIYVEQGTLSLHENSVDFHIHAGETLILWPGRCHGGLGTFPPALRFFWVHFEPDSHATDAPQSQLMVPQHAYIHDKEGFANLWRIFLAEQELPRQAHVLEGLLMVMLQQLTRSHAAREEHHGRGMTLAYQAKQIIRTQFHTGLSTASIARQLHCNVDYLGRVFRQTFQVTMLDSIHRQQIRYAEKQLLSDGKSLTNIAAEAGFNDMGYFRRVFKKRLGMTPSAYKRRYCKEHINSD